MLIHCRLFQQTASFLAIQLCHWPLQKKRGVPANSLHFTGFGRSENTTQVTTLVSLILPRDFLFVGPVSDRVQSAESGVPGGCSHLQCLSTQSAMYFQRPGSATAPFVLRRLLGTCEGVSPVLRLSESHEQAQGLGRTAVCRGQRLAWDAAVSLAAALESQLWSARDGYRTESETLASATRVETASISRRGSG